jgi:hypothetical protein
MRITIESFTNPINGAALLSPVDKSFASGGGGGEPADWSQMLAALTSIEAGIVTINAALLGLTTIQIPAIQTQLADINGNTAPPVNVHVV